MYNFAGRARQVDDIEYEIFWTENRWKQLEAELSVKPIIADEVIDFTFRLPHVEVTPINGSH